MDYNLSGNHVKFQFQDTPIIEGGISIHEIHGFVVILIATVASVHRLLFPHPQKFSPMVCALQFFCHLSLTFYKSLFLFFYRNFQLCILMLLLHQFFVMCP